MEIHHWCYTCWPLWQPAGPQFSSSHTIASRGEAIRSQNYDLIFKSRLWENCPQTQMPTTTTMTMTPTTNDDHIGSCWHSQMSQKGNYRLFSVWISVQAGTMWSFVSTFALISQMFCLGLGNEKAFFLKQHLWTLDKEMQEAASFIICLIFESSYRLMPTPQRQGIYNVKFMLAEPRIRIINFRIINENNNKNLLFCPVMSIINCHANYLNVVRRRE